MGERKIGYARVSTAGQDLETQHRALAAFGVEPDELYSEHMSGTKMNRPELDHALRVLKPGDRLVITKLDRLARSLKDLLTIIDQIEGRGASLVILDQSIDTSTSVGRLFVQILGAVAEFEAALVSERTKAALVGRPRGRRGGRPQLLTGRRLERARELYDMKEMTPAEVAAAMGVSRSTMYRSFRRAEQDTRPGPDGAGEKAG